MSLRIKPFAAVEAVFASGSHQETRFSARDHTGVITTPKCKPHAKQSIQDRTTEQNRVSRTHSPPYPPQIPVLPLQTPPTARPLTNDIPNTRTPTRAPPHPVRFRTPPPSPVEPTSSPPKKTTSSPTPPQDRRVPEVALRAGGRRNRFGTAPKTLKKSQIPQAVRVPEPPCSKRHRTPSIPPQAKRPNQRHPDQNDRTTERKGRLQASARSRPQLRQTDTYCLK